MLMHTFIQKFMEKSFLVDSAKHASNLAYILGEQNNDVPLLNHFSTVAHYSGQHSITIRCLSRILHNNANNCF
jgi:hypothetical protein